MPDKMNKEVRDKGHVYLKTVMMFYAFVTHTIAVAQLCT